MKNCIRYIFVMRSIFIFLFGLLQINSIVAQQKIIVPNGTQISDNTTHDALEPLPFSILDLSSSERGFLMPRLTTNQRDQIPSTKLVSGLTIYNTSMGCVEFYNTTRQVWMNLCGDVEPAVFIIPTDKCQKIKISGDYQQGIFLSERKHLITLEVYVSTPGTFDIEAIAYDNTGGIKNGYSFTTKGVFPTSGNFLLVLKGTGTPVKGYSNKNNKDVIKFWLNKKKSDCEVGNYVRPDYEQMVLEFVCNNTSFPIGVEGKYKIDEALNSANRIVVPFKVTKPGRGRVYGEIPKSPTQTELIKYESETIDFRETLPGEVQWVTLSPTTDSGKPTASGKLTGKLVFKSTGKNEYDPTVDPVLQTINGCDFSIDVERSLAIYTFVDNSLSVGTLTSTNINYWARKFITPVTDMSKKLARETFAGVVKVKVDRPGDYEIKTDEVNGLSYYAAGTISPKDLDSDNVAEILLMPRGKTGYDVTGVYRVTAFDSYKGNVNTSPIRSTPSNSFEFVYRHMKIYGIGSQGWYPGGEYSRTSDTYAAIGYFIDEFVPLYFSFDGKVRVDGISVITEASGASGGSYLDMTGNLTTFNSRLAQADIVMLGSRSATASYTKDNQALVNLANFAKLGGTVIYGEGGSASFRSQMGFFGSELGTSLSLSKGNLSIFTTASFNDVRSNHADLITNGLFGDMSSLLIGGHYGATTTSFSSIGNFSSLATTPSDGVFAAIHNTLGVVVVSSSTFMGGQVVSSGSGGYYPMRVNSSGMLLTAPAGTGYVVSNSTFLANLLHWAIVSAQEKKGMMYN